MSFARLLQKARQAPKNLSADDLRLLLGLTDPAACEDLFAAAREVRFACGRDAILPRGLIEVSNICAKDCLYCGIRKGNGCVSRYHLTEDEVRHCIDEARRRGYPAVAFQAGELEGEANAAFYERVLAECRGLEVTLSLGEQEESVYRRWKEAGALRYLIRIESSSPEHYARLHPPSCSFERRLSCIRTLKRLGYVTGSGVMIGFPGQTLDDLVRDVLFFGEERLDMVGMGPYVPHPDTPLAQSSLPIPPPAERLALGLKMIAATRLYLHAVNIVAATALETLSPEGRRLGVLAGANVVMPNLTPERRKSDYDLYPGKSSPASCEECIA